MSMRIPGIERLSEEFEIRGLTTKESLQYLKQGDLDMIFSSPPHLLLAEKRVLEFEICCFQENCLQPRQLTFDNSSTNSQVDIKQPTTPTSFVLSNPAMPGAPKQPTTDSPLERHKLELIENVSFLEAQISSVKEHSANPKEENYSFLTITRGRICSKCYSEGHNKNSCHGMRCNTHKKCRLKDKHPELSNAIKDTQNKSRLVEEPKSNVLQGHKLG